MASCGVQWPVERITPEEVGLCSKRLGRIGDVMKRYVEERRIAGVITLLVRRGRIAHLECFGEMDCEKKLPMREDALFRIYSMTKLVTSAAVLMLMEEGHFLLTEPVKKWLPEFGEVRVAVRGADGKEELVRPRRDVTIHDLLTHMGGLTYDLVLEARQNAWTLARFVTEFCKRPLRHHPGTVWDYSASDDVLGRFIEVVAGQPFEVFLRERIFGPLGMTDTDFWVPPEKAERLAQVYTNDAAGQLVPATDIGVDCFFKNPFFPSGGGGLVSSTSDYLRFALALLHGKWNGVRLLSPKTHALMTADHLPPGHAPLEIALRSFGFGLGVSVVRTHGETKHIGSIGEFGWGGAACTQVWLDPAEEMITMLMLQHRPKERSPLMDIFKQTAYQAIIA